MLRRLVLQRDDDRGRRGGVGEGGGGGGVGVPEPPPGMASMFEPLPTRLRVAPTTMAIDPRSITMPPNFSESELLSRIR